MKAWSVGDKWLEVQVPVIAPTRNRARVLGFREYRGWDSDIEYIDLRAWVVQSPTPVTGPERILDLAESFRYGFTWNLETMYDCFPEWSPWLAYYEQGRYA